MIQHVFLIHFDKISFVFLFLGGIHILSSTGIQEKRNDQNLSQEIFNEQQLPMARRSQTIVSEDYDSDFDDSSHEDDEPIPRTESIIEHEEEQRKQIIVEYTIFEMLNKIFYFISI